MLNSYTLFVDFFQTPDSQVTWYKGDSLIKQSRYFQMGNERDVFTLRISEAFPEDEGVYKCVASNSAGTLTTTARLYVTGNVKKNHNIQNILEATKTKMIYIF